MAQNHNMLLQQRLLGLQALLNAVHFSGSLDANAVKGAAREHFVRYFWSEFFPANQRMSSGQIIDSHGNDSGQVDIAIEFGFGPSFALGDQRLYLAESVAAVIEVKSNLAAQWGEVITKANQVKQLKRDIAYLQTHDTTQDNKHLKDIPFVVVGYDGYGDIDDLARKLLKANQGHESPLIDAALSIRRGAFVTSDGSLQASGGHSLLGLCAFITKQIGAVSRVLPSFDRYVKSTPIPTCPPGQGTSAGRIIGDGGSWSPV
ncbi:DUF6602 domain-containing protein [Dyella terrae]|uniref:DUF6602 domain-containing protein n=1 Tax=Dyella terrae TaxID=522259 RepID=UPI001EFE9236|nr:DUF6602 domain-containing protein [Dyella terrae]ULU23431.1 hypothetical protein DYST_00327 [Dyella terrae]